MLNIGLICLRAYGIYNDSSSFAIRYTRSVYLLPMSYVCYCKLDNITPKDS